MAEDEELDFAAGAFDVRYWWALELGTTIRIDANYLAFHQRRGLVIIMRVKN